MLFYALTFARPRGRCWQMHTANTDVTFCDGHRIKKNRTTWNCNAQEPIQSNSTSYPRHQTGKENIQFRRHKSRKPRGDGHQAILNTCRMKRQTESGRTLTIRINHNRNNALERSAKITGEVGGSLKRFYFEKKKKKTRPRFCCGLNTHKVFGPREDSSRHQNSNHINQDPTTLSWNKMRTQQQDPYWNAGATDIQQLNPNGPDQRASSPNQLYWTCLGRSLHFVWGTTRRRAVKEGSC